MNVKPSGVLTFTTFDGTPHLEIYRRWYDALAAAYKAGVKDGYAMTEPPKRETTKKPRSPADGNL